MEDNFVLAKAVVDEKFTKDYEYYYMCICALFGLLTKYPDNKDLVLKAFRDTLIIIENESILDIQKKYDLNLIKQEELDEQDQDVCTNYGVSDLGFGIYIDNYKLHITKDKPTLVCSSKKHSPANLLNVFIHELNHIIKGYNNSWGSYDDDKASSCFTRCGLNYTLYTYNKDTDELVEKDYYSILDEVINAFQTTDIMNSILMLDGVVPDHDFQKYLDSLDRKEMAEYNGYEKCCELFERIWKNDAFKEVLEEHLIDGDLEEVQIKFDELVGTECFDLMADSFDDLDYLFCLNKKRKEFEKCYNKLDKLINNIVARNTKKIFFSKW